MLDSSALWLQVRALQEERDELMRRLEASATAATAAAGAGGAAGGAGWHGPAHSRTGSMANLANGEATQVNGAPTHGNGDASARSSHTGQAPRQAGDGDGGGRLSTDEEDELDGLLGALLHQGSGTGSTQSLASNSEVLRHRSSANGQHHRSTGQGQGPHQALVARVLADPSAAVRTLELLQSRLRAAEVAREHAAEALCSAMQRADAAAAGAAEAADLRTALAEASGKVDFLLELLGGCVRMGLGVNRDGAAASDLIASAGEGSMLCPNLRGHFVVILPPANLLGLFFPCCWSTGERNELIETLQVGSRRLSIERETRFDWVTPIVWHLRSNSIVRLCMQLLEPCPNCCRAP